MKIADVDGWHVDPEALREVADDRDTLLAQLERAGAADRVRVPRLLGR